MDLIERDKIELYVMDINKDVSVNGAANYFIGKTGIRSHLMSSIMMKLNFRLMAARKYNQILTREEYKLVEIVCWLLDVVPAKQEILDDVAVFGNISSAVEKEIKSLSSIFGAEVAEILWENVELSKFVLICKFISELLYSYTINGTKHEELRASYKEFKHENYEKKYQELFDDLEKLFDTKEFKF